MQKPNYKKIYEQILKRKHFKKIEKIEKRLNDNMSVNDVLELSKIINPSEQKYNQKHKSYDLDFIEKVLKDQLKHNYTNIEISEKYNISKNTITKWKRNF